jgi:predicted HTH transcriptional regulator
MADKKEIIEEIAKLMESDPDATPMEPTVLEFLSEEELISVLKNLYKSKETRSQQNEEWFQELCK